MKTRNQLEQEIIQKAAEDEAFLKLLKQNPREAVQTLLPDDLEIPDNISISIIEESPTELTLVLPPESSSELGVEELDQVSAGAGTWDYIWGPFINDTSNDSCNETPS